mmetsp:Transcript_20110/g.43463  ORF Transcript_20110/g.43463 Transcript_20110/m.43463 type:complete len:200 (+) Transcript_20110:246-845(+)
MCECEKHGPRSTYIKLCVREEQTWVCGRARAFVRVCVRVCIPMRVRERGAWAYACTQRPRAGPNQTIPNLLARRARRPRPHRLGFTQGHGPRCPMSMYEAAPTGPAYSHVGIGRSGLPLGAVRTFNGDFGDCAQANLTRCARLAPVGHGVVVPDLLGREVVLRDALVSPHHDRVDGRFSLDGRALVRDRVALVMMRCRP